VGEWLPEPVATTGGALGPDDTVEQRESVSMALLMLLEKLTPTERAVYVLRDAFSYGYPEIAGILDLSEANCRQLHRRARQRLADERTRFSPSTGEWRQLVERFLAAARNGDLANLEEFFATDIIVWSDGGGKSPSGRRPVVGAAKVSRLFRGGFRKYLTDDVRLRFAEINGEPAVVGFIGSQILGVMTIEITDGLISGIRSVVNPDKLGFLGRQLSQNEGLPSQHG
jgi:RNA polymerase sigma-70 factor (ECF subfamily)